MALPELIVRGLGYSAAGRLKADSGLSAPKPATCSRDWTMSWPERKYVARVLVCCAAGYSKVDLKRCLCVNPAAEAGAGPWRSRSSSSGARSAALPAYAREVTLEVSGRRCVVRSTLEASSR